MAKRKVGRPAKIIVKVPIEDIENKPFVITPEILKEIEFRLISGVTIEQIRDFYCLSERSWRTAVESSSEFRRILKRSGPAGVAFAAGKLNEKIRQGNLSAIIYFLKTRGGGHWRESNVDSSYQSPAQKQDSPFIGAKLTMFTNDPNEAAKIYRKLMEES